MKSFGKLGEVVWDLLCLCFGSLEVLMLYDEENRRGGQTLPFMLTHCHCSETVRNLFKINELYPLYFRCEILESIFEVRVLKEDCIHCHVL